MAFQDSSALSKSQQGGGIGVRPRDLPGEGEKAPNGVRSRPSLAIDWPSISTSLGLDVLKHVSWPHSDVSKALCTVKNPSFHLLKSQAHQERERGKERSGMGQLGP